MPHSERPLLALSDLKRVRVRRSIAVRGMIAYILWLQYISLRSCTLDSLFTTYISEQSSVPLVRPSCMVSFSLCGWVGSLTSSSVWIPAEFWADYLEVRCFFQPSGTLRLLTMFARGCGCCAGLDCYRQLWGCREEALKSQDRARGQSSQPVRISRDHAPNSATTTYSNLVHIASTTSSCRALQNSH